MKAAPKSVGVVWKIAGIDLIIDYHCKSGQILPNFYVCMYWQPSWIIFFIILIILMDNLFFNFASIEGLSALQISAAIRFFHSDLAWGVHTWFATFFLARNIYFKAIILICGLWLSKVCVLDSTLPTAAFWANFFSIGISSFKRSVIKIRHIHACFLYFFLHLMGSSGMFSKSQRVSAQNKTYNKPPSRPPHAPPPSHVW